MEGMCDTDSRILLAFALCITCCVQDATSSLALAFATSSGGWTPVIRNALGGTGVHLRPATTMPQVARQNSPSSVLRMISDRANWADGGSKRRNWNDDPVAEAMAGSWKVEWSHDDKQRSTIVNLLPDGRVEPPDSEKTRVEKQLDYQMEAYLPSNTKNKKPVLLFGTWRLKGEDVNIVIHRHSTSQTKKFGQTVMIFQGMIKNETDSPYASKVKGNVLEGETDPEWAGKFNLTQMVGKASLGLGPSGPKVKETRASSGFALGGRSDPKVLKRFSGCWDATITLDGSRCTASLELFSNGTFVTTRYTKFAESGVKVGGVLRGRWNVYYSEDTQKERFWMQVLRLKSSGVNLWQDLLFLGDIDVVDTWKDIEELLARQLDLSRAGLVTNTTSSASSPEAAVDDLAGFQLSDAEGMPSVYPDNVELTPEDRGIFTSGKHRKYRFQGMVLAGHEFEPSIAGRCQLLQDTEPLQILIDLLKFSDECRRLLTGQRQDTETLQRPIDLDKPQA